MRRIAWKMVALLVLTSGTASSQEYDVTRRSYTFLGDRLVVQVESEVPGTLRVIRGEGGRVDVAGRAREGFVGFGLGGELTQQLRLSAVGGIEVEYLIVVPEDVRLTVQLPDRRGSDLGPRQRSAVFHWGPEDRISESVLLPTHFGLYVVHSSTWAPASLDLPDLAAIRSVSVRFEGGTFRIAASRPLTLQPGAPQAGIELRISGEPVDIVVHVPVGTAPFSVRAAGQRLVSVAGGRPTTSCTGVAVQQPTSHQVWFNFYPQAGRVSCR